MNKKNYLTLKTRKQTAIAKGIVALANKLGNKGFLPPETETAEALGVSRPTLRNVIAELKKRNIIETINTMHRVIGTGHPQALALPGTVAIATTHLQNGTEQSGSGWNYRIDLAVLSQLQNLGYNSLVVDFESLQGLKKQASTGISGLILLPFRVRVDPTILRLAQKIPIVSIFSHFHIDCACHDHRLGAADLTQLLLNKGCRKILRLWSDCGDRSFAAPWIQERNTGIEEVLSSAGLPVVPPLQWTAPFPPFGPATTKEEFEHAVKTTAGYLLPIFKDNPEIDALICVSDLYASIAAAACRLCGRIPGKDILITGYDALGSGNPLLKYEPCRPAGTIDRNCNTIGTELAKLLDRRIKGALPPAPVTIKIAHTVY